jgi:hypothetical protein
MTHEGMWKIYSNPDPHGVTVNDITIKDYDVIMKSAPRHAYMFSSFPRLLHLPEKLNKVL